MAVVLRKLTVPGPTHGTSWKILAQGTENKCPALDYLAEQKKPITLTCRPNTKMK